MIIDLRSTLKDAKWLWFLIAVSMLGGYGITEWILNRYESEQIDSFVDGLPISLKRLKRHAMQEEMYRSRLRSFGINIDSNVSIESLRRPCAIEVLLEKEAENLSLSVSEKDLQKSIVDSVPKELISNGTVDLEKYIQIVSQFMGVKVEDFEKEHEKDLEKSLVKRLISDSFYKPSYLQAYEAEEKNTLKEFEVISLPFEKFVNELISRGVSQDAVAEYFEKNKEKL